jgi:hypothetical protein
VFLRFVFTEMTIFGLKELFTFYESECKQLNFFVFSMRITAPAEIHVCVKVLPSVVETVLISSATCAQ